MSSSLVIGGAGFLGSHLVEALLARGHHVRVLDNFSSGRPAHLPASNTRLEVVRSDVSDLQAIRGAVQGVSHVFYMVTPSLASFRNDSGDRWAGTSDTLNVLAAAHHAGVKRLIYSSCASVYGLSSVETLTEANPTLPASLNAFAKLTGEQQCVAYSAVFGMETVRLRYFNVFGPRQKWSEGSPVGICDIVRTMLLGQNPTIDRDGNAPHDFIYVDDVVHANCLAAEAPRVSGKVYNIARGRPTTFNEIVAKVNALLGTRLQARYARGQMDTRGPRGTDASRAEVELGFCPSTDLDQGLQRCIAYYRQHAEELETPRSLSHLGGPHFPRVGSDTPAGTNDEAGASATSSKPSNDEAGAREQRPQGSRAGASASRRLMIGRDIGIYIEQRFSNLMRRFI
jgi:UDP-glucose 4-epimerase